VAGEDEKCGNALVVGGSIRGSVVSTGGEGGKPALWKSIFLCRGDRLRETLISRVSETWAENQWGELLLTLNVSRAVVEYGKEKKKEGPSGNSRAPERYK